ncbi:TPA: hypothetical protein NNT57_004631 [Salmonella enterica]|nr:hypothetical protein [Salmonella enterica]HCH9143087.1 hypothetical protein [Salmonella enterica]
MNIELLKERSETGLSKYGVNLERTDLSPTDWAQHLVEELLDGANYAQVLKDKLALTIEAAFKEGFQMGQEMDTYEPFVFCWRGGAAEAWVNSDTYENLFEKGSKNGEDS